MLRDVSHTRLGAEGVSTSVLWTRRTTSWNLSSAAAASELAELDTMEPKSELFDETKGGAATVGAGEEDGAIPPSREDDGAIEAVT